MSAIELVHSLPGRTRLRLTVRRDLELLERIGRAVAEVPGVIEVRLRPTSGSILVKHEPHQVEAGHLLARALRLVEGVAAAPLARPIASTIAVQMAKLFRDLDKSVLEKSEGTIDLGTLVTLGFVSAGAVDVIRTQRLPSPPWFNLAWWGFRTFMTLEKKAIKAARRGALARAVHDLQKSEDDDDHDGRTKH